MRCWTTASRTSIHFVGYCRPCCRRLICRRALLRGRYMAAVASMEHTGTPIDTATLNALRANWASIKGRLTREIDREYGVYVAGGRYRVNPKTLFGQEVLAIAAEVGCHPYYVQVAGRYVFQSRREAVGEIREAELAAPPVTGLTVNAIARWENAGRDYSTWPGLDVVARNWLPSIQHWESDLAMRQRTTTTTRTTLHCCGTDCVSRRESYRVRLTRRSCPRPHGR